MTTPAPPSRGFDPEAEQEVDFAKYVRMLGARWWLLLAGLVVGAVIGYLVSLGGSQVYAATATMYLGQPYSASGNIALLNAQTNPGAVAGVIQSASVQGAVAHLCGVKASEFRKGISSQAAANSTSSTKSGQSQAPSASVGVPPDSDYALTGGGAETTWNIGDGTGSYLTASYPTKDNSGNPVWFAASKDHLEPCSAVITTYAIGVKWSDKATWNPSRIVAEISQNESNPDQHPSVTVGAPGGTVMVGGGAYDNYRSGTGNLLVQSYPADAETWSASGTDHLVASPGTLTVYAIGVRNMQVGS